MAVRPDKKTIIDQRIKRGWPQEQLAEIADVSLKTIQRVEQGNPAAFNTLQAIANAFDLTVEDLLLKEDNAPKPDTKPTEPKIHHLPRLQSGDEILKIVGLTGTISFDNPDPKSQEEMQALRDFSQEIHDCADIWTDVSPGYRIEMSFNLTTKLAELYKMGFSLFGMTRVVRYSSQSVGRPLVMNQATLVIVRNDNPIIVRLSDTVEFLPVSIANGPFRFV